MGKRQFPETTLRPLSKEDIVQLSARDAEEMKSNLERHSCATSETLIAVLPTPELIGWLHRRGDITCSKITGRTPEGHGSLCSTEDYWLYWHHDFRKQQLAIQRVHIPISESPTKIDRLANLLLDALKEAQKWQLASVIVWEGSEKLLEAMQLLKGVFDIEIESKERNKSVPSFRLRKADQTRKATMLMNENYAWS